MSNRRQPARFWLVAVGGGIVVVALSVGAALLIQIALNDAPRSTTITIPIVISLVFWISGMTYAYNRSSNSSD